MNGQVNSPMDDDRHSCRLTWSYDAPEDSGLDADQRTCMQFDSTGEFLAVGDRGGKIYVCHNSTKSSGVGPTYYETYCQFTSHESEFDYLKSIEIEEKINKIRWLPQQTQTRHLLSTNDKTIKLWRLSEKNRRPKCAGPRINQTADAGFEDTFEEHNGSGDLETTMKKVEAQPRRIFANAHAYHVNSISVNSDQETFLSSDDLRINLWHLDVTNQSFNIVDIKPANMEELSEVITGAEFHPRDCSLFMYSSSRGILRLCDMRQRALCDDCAVTFQEPGIPDNRGFFAEIVNSITDLKFNNSGRYVVSRDYLTMKVWDLHMATEPVEQYLVHDHFRGKFVYLYENDCIFDKFECAWSHDSKSLITGSYHNLLRVFDRTTGEGSFVEFVHGNDTSPGHILPPRDVNPDPIVSSPDEISVDAIDYSKKLLYLDMHPSMDRVAVASGSNIYLATGRVEVAI